MTQQPMPPVASEPEDDDEFPDPKRSWKRTGSLLGGWAGTWVAVAILGTLWSLLGLAQAVQEDPDDNDDTAYAVIDNYFNRVFGGTEDTAAELQCSDYRGPEPDGLRSDLDPFKLSNGDPPPVEVGIPRAQNADKTKYLVKLSVGSTDNPQPIVYTAQARNEGSRYCISIVERA